MGDTTDEQEKEMPEKRDLLATFKEFTKKLIDFITGGSKETGPALSSFDLTTMPHSPQFKRTESTSENHSHPRLSVAIAKALERYKKKGYLHHRNEAFNRLMRDIINVPYPINWLQSILTFVDEGGWKSNSGNTLLYYELINATGYVRDKEETDAYLLDKVLTPLDRQF